MLRRLVFTTIGFFAIPPALCIFLFAYILLRLPRPGDVLQ